MFTFPEKQFQSKKELYEELILSIKGLISGENDLIANLSNVSSLIFHFLNNVNWAGFYLLKGNQLVLGPFQGQPGCIRIKLGKGVCGTAAINQATVVVKDVHEFDGHIACDSRTNSEIVVPMMKDGQLVGVLDIDSLKIDNFDETDKIYLEEIVKILMAQCVIN